MQLMMNNKWWKYTISTFS